MSWYLSKKYIQIARKKFKNVKITNGELQKADKPRFRV